MLGALGVILLVLSVLLIVLTLSGCAATTNPRFTRHRVPLSRWCVLTLIRDTRTAACLVSYECSWSGVNGLTVAPTEVCAP